MPAAKPRGAIYRCPVCGAEVIVLAPCQGSFAPRCCNQPMEYRPQRVRFYVCPVCGSEIAALNNTSGSQFTPRCCGQHMRPAA